MKSIWPIMSSKLILLIALAACNSRAEKGAADSSKVRLVTLDPGHFHAALVQKKMYPDVDSTVFVYAPETPDVQLHLEKIKAYNEQPVDPTRWNEQVYTGSDFFTKMLEEKKGNVVVLAGNNRQKTEYIKRSVDAGLNVLADKPMAIDGKSFKALEAAFETAKKKDLLLYDIMTERYEITTMLQREFSMLPELFGSLEKGTPDNPSVTKESTHHFYKYVSGKVLTRPAWFMDVTQEGEGIVDVTTHLVDLIQWECFPDQIIRYQNDVKVNSARRWYTEMTLSQFKSITKQDKFPDYLKKDVVNDSVLRVYSNGEINYQLKGVHARVSVNWAFQAPEGTGDTHYSIMRGTKANLVIRQGAEQNYKPVLYIEPASGSISEDVVNAQLAKVQAKYPGISVKKLGKGWEVVVPEKYKEGHEAHFARVMEKFLEYLKNKNIPEWEVPNMIAKYYTTTKGLELARAR
ncbi:putative oxidoreductase C-terminal domain-containing protein [Desertivirga xinjiangensis]|uniref:putative oxidoreductase C-terminal domain-containing protein n=1 Tax=Desertivirga xinjiangensis TaxID=539206 RepID=UPI00210B7DA0|nr:putative oxidoreductase C-terminal domain-containing protein [Pedobacter xinjiangensis]